MANKTVNTVVTVAQKVAMQAQANVTAQQEQSVQKALALLNAQATAQQASAAQATTRAAQMRVNADERAVCVIFSAQLKQCFITTNALYCKRTVEQVVAIAKKDLAKKAKVQQLLQAGDITAMYVNASVTKSDNAAQIAKAQVTAQYVADGWVVTSTARNIVA